jgi:hypothetical protein
VDNIYSIKDLKVNVIPGSEIVNVDFTLQLNEPIHYYTIFVDTPSTKNYRIFSEKTCKINKECSKCFYFIGTFDQGEVVPGKYIKNADSSLYITEDMKDIKVSSFPVTVCDTPPQSIAYIKDLCLLDE